MDQSIDAQQVDFALPLRTHAQSLDPILLGALVQSLHEQLRMLDHPLPHRTAGLLVMIEPMLELTRRERGFRKRRQQAICVHTTGARQWCNHPRRCPSRKPAGAHCCQRRIGQ
jgi:hypothetical protein